MAAAEEEEGPLRPIRTDYYFGRKHVRQTRCKWAHKALPRAHEHMDWDYHDVDRAEIYDVRTGALLGVLRSRLVNGKRITRTVMERKGMSAIASERQEANAEEETE